MKTIRKIIVLVFILLIFFSFNNIYAFYFFDYDDQYEDNGNYDDYYENYNNYSNYSYDNEIVINNMNYHMTVNEDHSYFIQVNEQVTINTYLHGIYRAIARRGTYYREVDGKENATNYSAIIKDVEVESGQPFETSKDGDAFIIQIGNPNEYVTGIQNYSYSYLYDPGDDGISSFDDVYKNIISQYLENPIEHLNITIDMPKDFDSKNILFFDGEYGTIESNLMRYNVNGKQITAVNTSTIYPGTVVSVRIALPEGYFQNVFTGREYLPYYYGLAAVILLIGGLIYIFLGKGKKPLEPVTFYPPDGLDSSQVAYILNSTVTNEMLVSLLIYFADKGWLTIENLSSSQKNPEYIINKVQDIPFDRPNFEKTIFNAIFSRSDNPELRDLTAKRFMGNAFISAKDQLQNWFTGENSVISTETYTSKFLIFLAILVNSLAFSIICSFLVFREVDFVFIVIMLICSAIGSGVLVFSTRKVNFITAGILIGLGILITYMFSGSLILILVNFLVNTLCGILGYLSIKRTPKGNKWYGECKAFKHFIETAELDRLKLLVEDNPTYYYNILPYAYAMDLTDKWAKNFEGIAINPPDWYIDPYFNMQMFRTFYFMNMFNRGIARNINHINTQAIRSMGSGGFGGRGFGGGGFGGGGFGGGGAGGMGGGGW